MTRGNQREKAREKNLKEAASAVSATDATAGPLEYDTSNTDSFSEWKQALIYSMATGKEEHTIRHRIPADQRSPGCHHARKAGKR